MLRLEKCFKVDSKEVEVGEMYVKSDGKVFQMNHAYIYIYICSIIRDNVAYEYFRVLNYLQTKLKYKA